MEVKQLPKREELPENLIWDLTKTSSSDKEFDEKYPELLEKLKKPEKYKGTLNQGVSQFLDVIGFVLSVYCRTKITYVYAHPKNDRDTGNTEYQALYARVSSLFSKVSEAVSWFEPEISQLLDEQIQQYFKEEPKLEVYRHYIRQIADNRAHASPADRESLLTGAGKVFKASSGIFAVLNSADLVFPTIEGENGEKV